MEYFVFDTEATGLFNADEVIQFAGILTDENFSAIKFVNFYCDTLQQINPSALATHRITKEELHLRSDGRFFEEYYKDFQWLFGKQDIVWIGWNVEFDIRMVNNTLTGNGYEAHDFGTRIANLNAASGKHYYDLMAGVSALSGAGYRLKLSDALLRSKYTVEMVDGLHRKYVGDDSSTAFHRADYDSLATWILLNHYGNRLR